MSATKQQLLRFANDRERGNSRLVTALRNLPMSCKTSMSQIRPSRTEQIALRLCKDDLEALKRMAKRRGVDHTTLVRSIVEQWVGRLAPRPSDQDMSRRRWPEPSAGRAGSCRLSSEDARRAFQRS